MIGSTPASGIRKKSLADGDTAVIAAVGEPVFDGTDTVQSVDIEPDAAFAIAEGQFTVTEGLTIGAGGGFKIANSGLTTGKSISVAIDGAVTNSGFVR